MCASASEPPPGTSSAPAGRHVSPTALPARPAQLLGLDTRCLVRPWTAGGGGWGGAAARASRLSTDSLSARPWWHGAGPPCCGVADEPSNLTSSSDWRGWQGVVCALQYLIGSSRTGGARHGRMTGPAALRHDDMPRAGPHHGRAPDRLPSGRRTDAHGTSSWPEEVLWRAQRTTTRSHGFEHTGVSPQACATVLGALNLEQ